MQLRHAIDAGGSGNPSDAAGENDVSAQLVEELATRAVAEADRLMGTASASASRSSNPEGSFIRSDLADRAQSWLRETEHSPELMYSSDDSVVEVLTESVSRGTEMELSFGDAEVVDLADTMATMISSAAATSASSSPDRAMAARATSSPTMETHEQTDWPGDARTSSPTVESQTEPRFEDLRAGSAEVSMRSSHAQTVLIGEYSDSESDSVSSSDAAHGSDAVFASHAHAVDQTPSDERQSYDRDGDERRAEAALRRIREERHAHDELSYDRYGATSSAETSLRRIREERQARWVQQMAERFHTGVQVTHCTNLQLHVPLQPPTAAGLPLRRSHVRSLSLRQREQLSRTRRRPVLRRRSTGRCVGTGKGWMHRRTPTTAACRHRSLRCRTGPTRPSSRGRTRPTSWGSRQVRMSRPAAACLCRWWPIRQLTSCISNTFTYADAIRQQLTCCCCISNILPLRCIDDPSC